MRIQKVAKDLWVVAYKNRFYYGMDVFYALKKALENEFKFEPTYCGFNIPQGYSSDNLY